jgi:hypothetical protein
VLAAHEAGLVSALDDALQELTRDVVLDESLAVLREGRCVEGEASQIHVDEPTEEHVVLELLADLTLTSNRVEHHEQQGLELTLRWNRRPSHAAVHTLERRVEVLQRRVRQTLYPPERVIGRHQRARGREHQHGRLILGGATHVS